MAHIKGCADIASNNSSLKLDQLTDSSYCYVNKTPFSNRPIYRYRLKNNSSESIESAVITITLLLKSNPHLIPTFPTPVNREIVEKCTGLTINGKAVCLYEPSDVSVSSCSNSNFKDKYFSEQFLGYPIKCKEGHYLELEYARYWSQTSRECPAGKHPILSFEVDEELQDEVVRYVDAKREKAKERQQLLIWKQNQEDKVKVSVMANTILKRKVECAALTIQHNNVVNQELSEKFKIAADLLVLKNPTLSAVAKIPAKMVSLSYYKKIATQVRRDKITACVNKFLGKETFIAKHFPNVLKRMPVLSIVFAGPLVKHYNQNKLQASLEIVSAISATIPLLGTTLSCIIDGVTVRLDAKQLIKAKEKTLLDSLKKIQDTPALDYSQVEAEPTFEEACRFLSLKQEDITSEQVEAAYGNQMALTERLDDFGDVGENAKPHVGAIKDFLNQCRNAILEQLAASKAER